MKKKKLIILLSLAMPLTVNALNLQGTQTFTEEVNITATHNFENDGGVISDVISGIKINPDSNTVFEKDVIINLSKNNFPNAANNSSFNGITNNIQTLMGTSSTTFNGNLTINMKGDSATAISLYDENANLTVNGKANISVDDTEDEAIYMANGGNIVFNGETHINSNIDAISILGSGSNLTFNGESYIKGDIDSAEGALLKINNKSIINGDIYAELGGTVILDLAAGSKIVGAASSLFNDDGDDPEYLNQDTTGIIKMNLDNGASWEINQDLSLIHI